MGKWCMMDIFPAILFAVSSNIDSLILGISLGMRNVNLNVASNVIISFVTLIFTVISMYAGKFLSYYLPEKTALLVGSVTLIMIGIYYIQKYFLKRSGELLYISDESGGERRFLTTKQAAMMGFMLSVNNLGLGIGSGIGGLNLLLGSAFSLVIGFLFLNSANILGRGLILKVFGEFGELISGIIIVILGIYQSFF